MIKPRSIPFKKFLENFQLFTLSNRFHNFFKTTKTRLNVFNDQVFESFRDFIISYAEFEGITIDEHVLNNSLHPMQEDEDKIDEIVDILALL